MTERSHRGLVLRDVTVKRGGKTFTQKRWVKAGEDEPEEKKGKKSDLISQLKIGDIVNVGGKLSKVKSINEKGKVVILHNDILGNEVYDFDKLNKIGKLETSEGRFKSYNVGEQFNFLGDKYMKVEKVNESEQTVKLSNGLVYTFAAIEAGKKGISGGKHNIGDKVTFQGVERLITYINQVTDTVELDNMGSVPFKELNKTEVKPKKETKIKDLKQIKKKSEKEIKRAIPTGKESKIIKGSAKDGSLTAKDRKNADKQLQEFINNNKEQEIKKGIHEFDRMSGAAKQYTAGSSFMMTAYLLNDRKQGYDFETRGLKNIDEEEREWYESKINLLDEFLDKAPKVETTSYRGMHWDMSDEHESKLYKTFTNEMKVGSVIESKAYSSTTVSKSILSDYSSSRIGGMESSKYAKIEYETKSGVYIASESQTYEQLEVLLPHHTKFKVIKNEMKGNTHTIKLREVD